MARCKASIQSACGWPTGHGEQAPNPDSLDTRHQSEGGCLPGVRSMPSMERSADRPVRRRFWVGNTPRLWIRTIGWPTAGRTREYSTAFRTDCGDLYRGSWSADEAGGRHGAGHRQRQNPIATSASDCDCTSLCRCGFVGSLSGILMLGNGLDSGSAPPDDVPAGLPRSRWRCLLGRRMRWRPGSASSTQQCQGGRPSQARR